MLWYKSWLETRWRFLIGLALLLVLAGGTVFSYPTLLERMPLAQTIDTSGPLGRMLEDAIEIQSDYRGFVWWQWFRQNLAQTWTLFAVLLGSGGLLAKASGGSALFTLSLPASRNRLLTVHAATGLAELLVLAFVPSLLIPLLSPAVGQSYGVGDVMIHGVCLFVAGAAFFSLAVLLSTVFSDIWRPLLIVCAVAVLLALGEQVVSEGSEYGIFQTMTAATYVRSGSLPWTGLLVGAGASAAMLYGALFNFARADF